MAGVRCRGGMQCALCGVWYLLRVTEGQVSVYVYIYSNSVALHFISCIESSASLAHHHPHSHRINVFLQPHPGTVYIALSTSLS